MIKRIARWILREELKNIRTLVENDRRTIQAYEDQLEALAQVQRKPVIRLSRDVFSHFKSKLPKMVIGSASTDQQAAFLVGVQHAVDQLEDQLVDERS